MHAGRQNGCNASMTVCLTETDVADDSVGFKLPGRAAHHSAISSDRHRKNDEIGLFDRGG